MKRGCLRFGHILTERPGAGHGCVAIGTLAEMTTKEKKTRGRHRLAGRRLAAQHAKLSHASKRHIHNLVQQQQLLNAQCPWLKRHPSQEPDKPYRTIPGSHQ